MTDTVAKTHELKLKSGKTWTLHQMDPFDYVQLEDAGFLAKGPGNAVSNKAVLYSLWIAAKRSHPDVTFEEFCRSMTMEEIREDDGPVTEAAHFVWGTTPFSDSQKDTSTSSSSGG